MLIIKVVDTNEIYILYYKCEPLNTKFHLNPFGDEKRYEQTQTPYYAFIDFIVPVSSTITFFKPKSTSLSKNIKNHTTGSTCNTVTLRGHTEFLYGHWDG
jgi:hypothetical protein